MKSLVAMLLLLVATATAAPCPPAKGSVLFAIARHHPAQPTVDDVLTIYSDGAWTRTATDVDGKRTRSEAGCLDKPALAKLDKTLHAPWTVETMRIHCMARTADFTAYTVNDKQVYVEQVCAATALDAKSHEQLEAAIGQASSVGTKP